MDEFCNIREPEHVKELLKISQNLNFNMNSELNTCLILKVLAASKPGGQFLEIGTGLGVGCSWILDGMDQNSKLTSIDNNESQMNEVRHYFNDDKRLHLKCIDGELFLKNEPEKFYDFIFADSFPGKYYAFDDAIRILKRGGFYIIDDMLPQPNWPEGHEIKVAELLSRLENQADLQIVKMNWASGLVICVKK